MKTIGKMFRVSICAVLVAQWAGCGTILHPERKGQRDGRIDPGIAVLDGLGLLFFIIPGVIAFAVDFSNGTIYLPGTFAKFDPKHSNAETIEKIIEQKTGYRVKLDQENIQVSRLESLDEMNKRFAEVSPQTRDIRLALNSK